MRPWLQGTLERGKVEEMLSLILPTDSVASVSNLIFTTFDKDHNGNLNFVEFVTSLHCMSSSSPEVRIPPSVYSTEFFFRINFAGYFNCTIQTAQVRSHYQVGGREGLEHFYCLILS